MNITAKIRRQGGAAVVTIPPVLLKMMGAEVGGQLTLAVVNGELVARPVRVDRRRYTLSELLEGADQMTALNDAVAGARDGDPVGNEIG